MSHSLPALAFVLASQSLVVAANNVYLRDSVFILARDNGDGDSSSSTTTTHTTSTTTTTTTTSSSSSSTTSSSSSTTSSSSSTTSSSSSTTTTDSSSTSTTQSSSSSTATTTGTLTSFSSSYTSSTNFSSSRSAQNNDGLTSTASQGLSTAARTGLAFGIMFSLIFCAMLVCYLRRRSRKARENVNYGPALLSSEVSQYRPPDSVTSRERELPPPPRPDTAYPNSPDALHSPPLSAVSSAFPLLSDDPRRDSHPASTWNRYSALSQATDTQPITTQDAPTLPNPYDPFSASARSASYISTASSPTHTMLYSATLTSPYEAFSAPTRSASHASTVSSPTQSIPYGASVPASAATSTSATPVIGSSQPQRRLSALHADLTLHQKQLELDHKKRSLDAQEPQDPPPQYSS